MSDPVTPSVAAPIVDAAIRSFSEKLISKAGKIAKPVVDKAVVDLGIGFRSYLELSYNKCRNFKTILNPGKPIPVIDHYVHNTLSCGNTKKTDSEIIDSIASINRLVITGLAGSGKSMFMKYLTVCCFENPKGRIPLFVELRNFNSLTKKDVLSFIKASCVAKGRSVTDDQFNLALSSGTFILILDGFDEISYESRDDLSKQILSISKQYPDTPIVVSSRQDDRFGGWGDFWVYGVDDLSKDQTLELIESLDYDEGVKRRFAKQVSTSLYASHTSFLSSPLLTTIMLLTYEEFAEIPVKMHAFYSQAFDTLFQKHDASKEQYQRSMHTGLSREDFRATFSGFCAMSYLNERFSFEEDELDETATAAVKYIRQAKSGIPRTLNAKSLITDLKESVCLLQQDGLQTAFVHRSFQEYFAALFAASLHGEKIRDVLDKYAIRFGDSAIGMALDISREAVEQEWVLPTIARLESQLSLDDPEPNLTKQYACMFDSVFWHAIPRKGGAELFPGLRSINSEVVGPLETICRLYPKKLGSGLVAKSFQLGSPENLKPLVSEEYRDKAEFKYFKALYEGEMSGIRDTRRVGPVEFKGDQDWWLKAIGADSLFTNLKTGFASIRRDISSRTTRRKNILSDFL